METKHTKGEWKLSKNHIICNGKNVAVAMIMNYKHDNKGRLIDDEEMPANARLIAASPELLEALQTIINIINEDEARGRRLSKNDLEFRITASQAINKAING